MSNVLNFVEVKIVGHGSLVSAYMRYGRSGDFHHRCDQRDGFATVILNLKHRPVKDVIDAVKPIVSRPGGSVGDRAANED